LNQLVDARKHTLLIKCCSLFPTRSEATLEAAQRLRNRRLLMG